jgi:hypothetical protein
MKRALVACLLLGLAAVSAKHGSLGMGEVFLGTESSNETVLLAPQVTLAGLPLATLSGVSEPEACSARCRSNPECLAFNYCQEEVGGDWPRPPSPLPCRRLGQTLVCLILLPAAACAGHHLPGRQQHHAKLPRVPAAQLRLHACAGGGGAGRRGRRPVCG